MRRWILIVLITGFVLVSTGCVTYIAIWNRPHRTPAYCYDCHGHPGWVRVYTQCDYYTFKVADGGYHYKPRLIKHAKYDYRTYDKKVVRERQKIHAEYIKQQKADKKINNKNEKKKKTLEKKPKRGY